jgi:hypothetical protein
MAESTPWPKTPPPDAPRAVTLIADVLHDTFKGDTGVDLDMLAAEAVDALQGQALTVELRWYDGDDATNEGVVVLGRIERNQSSPGAKPSRPNPALCCGDALFWCPTAEQVECTIHGGFDDCCEHPEQHVGIPAALERFPREESPVIRARPVRGDAIPEPRPKERYES